MELKPKKVATKTVVYRTETYSLTDGVNLVVEYTDGVITEQKLSVTPAQAKKQLSPFARETPQEVLPS